MRHKINVSVKKNPGLQILDDPKPEVMRLSKVALRLGTLEGRSRNDITVPEQAWEGRR